jgi:hypothetical protein
MEWIREWDQDTLTAIKHLTQNIQDHAKYVDEKIKPLQVLLTARLEKLSQEAKTVRYFVSLLVQCADLRLLFSL